MNDPMTPGRAQMTTDRYTASLLRQWEFLYRAYDCVRDLQASVHRLAPEEDDPTDPTETEGDFKLIVAGELLVEAKALLDADRPEDTEDLMHGEHGIHAMLTEACETLIREGLEYCDNEPAQQLPRRPPR